MRKPLFLILSLVFSVLFLYFIIGKDGDDSFKKCTALAHEAKVKVSKEESNCLNQFVDEKLPNLFLIEIMKQRSPDQFAVFLNNSIPLMSEKASQLMGNTLIALSLKYRLEQKNEEYYTIVEWLENTHLLETWILKWKLEKFCFERDERCSEIASQIKNKIPEEERLSYLKQVESVQEVESEIKDYDEELEEQASTHFVLWVDESVASLAKDQFEIIEEALTNIRAIYDWYPVKKVPVVLYENQKFSGMGEGMEWAEALYDGKIRIPIKVIDHRDHFLKVAKHEITHAMLDERFGKIPTWFHEGLAQLNEGKSCIQKPDVIFEPQDLEGYFTQLGGNSRILDAYHWSLFAVCSLADRYGKSSFWNLINRDVELDFEKSFQTEYGISPREFLEELNNL